MCLFLVFFLLSLSFSLCWSVGRCIDPRKERRKEWSIYFICSVCVPFLCCVTLSNPLHRQHTPSTRNTSLSIFSGPCWPPRQSRLFICLFDLWPVATEHGCRRRPLSMHLTTLRKEIRSGNVKEKASKGKKKQNKKEIGEECRGEERNGRRNE